MNKTTEQYFDKRVFVEELTSVTNMAEGEEFLCGVVEGFYSRPWSEDQRLDLYEKMEKYGLNTYVCTLSWLLDFSLKLF